ncbi:hypothetical protein, partial [Burkholderia ubonensis]|uniref:hypothetical protein n=1 Tax=Burkholderia ubonensis TaxID=101571 RepID=UPI001E58BF89
RVLSWAPLDFKKGQRKLAFFHFQPRKQSACALFVLSPSPLKNRLHAGLLHLAHRLAPSSRTGADLLHAVSCRRRALPMPGISLG